ncbi:circadian clock-controlled protein daywake-like [Vanessa atalanta]|uniref:circadian clock-controlled protein daywake-like n=1 Tax=Vanessa atalanta TaxID=42275 RepID=UPI001FCDA461|nr:circadian clock-controlled protein daywake-like [Vanessa atalanta]
MYLSLLITFMCLAGGVFSSSLFSPCKKNDLPCIETTVNDALPKIFAGIPELGIPKTDPQFVAVIDADLTALKYTFYNSTIYGYKNCKMSNLKINDDLTKISGEVLCSSLMMDGVYEMKGRLITLPIEGNGNYMFEGASFHVDFDIKLDKIKGSDGKTHLFIRKITYKAKPLTPIKFNFQNLFNGKEDLAAVVKKFAQENWLEITLLLQDPIWEASLDQLKAAVNKYLATFAIDDTILN